MDAEKQYRTIEDPYTQAVCIPRNPFGIGVVLTVANDRARVLYNLIEDNDRGGISVDGYGCSDRSGDGKPVCIDNRIEENKIYDNARGMGSEVYYGLQLYLARGVLAEENVADDNYGSGFLFLYRGAGNSSPDFSGFSLYKNDAQGGGKWGFAVISTVDGVHPVPPKNLGENVASSNGASPQCAGFRCTD